MLGVIIADYYKIFLQYLDRQISIVKSMLSQGNMRQIDEELAKYLAAEGFIKKENIKHVQEIATRLSKVK